MVKQNIYYRIIDLKDESATKANFNLTQSDIWEESAFIDPEAPFSLSKCVTVNLPNDLKNQHLSLEVTVNVSSIDMLFWEFTENGRSGVYVSRDYEPLMVTVTEDKNYGG